MASRVEAFAALCLPDFTYTANDLRNLSFAKIDLSAFLGEDETDPYCGLMIDVDGQPKPHVFTRWSRGQLLSHLGCREKWFESVMKDQEVAELNQRLHTLRPYRFRTMKSYDSPELLVVRGFVSRHFADIPDPLIMKALLEVLPEGMAVRGVSGKTDRAFYAYSITQEKITIPGTDFVAYPGLVTKNSEVGYTSLWVVPMMYVPAFQSCVVLSRHAALRKVHRGDPSDLVGRFNTATDKAKELWGSFEEKLGKLTTLTFLSEEIAVTTMRSLLTQAKSEQSFINECVKAYEAENHTAHSALNIFKAILSRVEKECDKDDAYVSSELAGAVLIQLLK